MNKNDSKALDSFYSQCILNGFQTHFEWVSLVSGRISMHFQVIFNGIWKEFQLVLEGISIDFGWISMLSGRRFNWSWKGFQLNLAWIPIDSGRNFNWFWKEFQLSVDGCQCFWGGLQCILDWCSMEFEWIPMHLGLLPNAFWIDFNAFWIDSKCILNGFQCILGWFPVHFEWIPTALWMDGTCFWQDFNAFWIDFQTYSKSIRNPFKRHWTSIQNALKSFQKQAKPIQNAFGKTASRRLDNIPTARPFPIGGQSLRGLMFFLIPRRLDNIPTTRQHNWKSIEHALEIHPKCIAIHPKCMEIHPKSIDIPSKINWNFFQNQLNPF